MLIRDNIYIYTVYGIYLRITDWAPKESSWEDKTTIQHVRLESEAGHSTMIMMTP